MAIFIGLLMAASARVLDHPDNLFANPRGLFGFYLGFAITNLAFVIWSGIAGVDGWLILSLVALIIVQILVFFLLEELYKAGDTRQENAYGLTSLLPPVSSKTRVLALLGVVATIAAVTFLILHLVFGIIISLFVAGICYTIFGWKVFIHQRP